MSDSLKDFSDAMAAVVGEVGGSVVRVDARHRFPATGIVWNAEGAIVTAHHVVEREENIIIGLPDGSTVEADLVGRDPHNDIAVLKTDAVLAPVTWAEVGVIKIGHPVFAVGRPANELQATVGVVSAISGKQMKPHESLDEDAHGHGHRHQHGGRHGGNRSMRRFGRRGRGREWERMLAGGHIRTDVTMYPGFSGGPLVSAYGTVYGMNTSGFAHGASLAVPTNSLQKSVVALLAHGKVRQGYLGVSVQTVRLPENVAVDLDNDTGALVISVEEDSPAQKAGLIVGDIIVSIGEESIADVDELPPALSGDLIGQEVPVTLVRGGALLEVPVVIGEQG
jgi:S1-C subfamily serine protease